MIKLPMPAAPAASTPEPLPQRDPGATFRKPPATVAAPRPVPAGSPR